MTLQGCFPPNFNSFGQAVSEDKIFLEINKLEEICACGDHGYKQVGTKLAIFIEGFHRCLLRIFGSFGPAVLEKMLLIINQSEKIIACGSHVC
jgi:hypothetical protein